MVELKAEPRTLENFIGGSWVRSDSSRQLEVVNPATAETLATVPLSSAADVDRAVQAANAAFWEWRSTPPLTRARYMFALKNLMEAQFEELARIVVQENGKTIEDARGEVRRAIENVEVATGITSLMMGMGLEDVARGIDSEMVRQPIGVFAAISPFNFPSMVPSWFLPHALVCGNTFILKPSEQVPLSAIRMVELCQEAGMPAGVVSLVNGDKEAVDALLTHPGVRGISFVGSAAIARYVYATAAATFKRVQALGGAKNHLIVMPDAVIEQTVANILGSSFGAAGQRCLAGSVIVTVGDAHDRLLDSLVPAAAALKLGYGLDPETQMGPVVSKKAQARIVGYIDRAAATGVKMLLDGRNPSVPKYPNGSFVGPTIFDDVDPSTELACDEIFGPVVGIVRAKDLDQALAIMNRSRYGNAGAIFTQSGKAAREFKYRAQAGMLGVNVGVAAPMAFFPFTGWKDSFLGDLHGHGRDGIEFFTEKKVVMSRWF